jgi:beta-1,4-mannosyltransferase
MRIASKPAYSNREKNPYNSLLYEHIKNFGCCVEELSIKGCFTTKYEIVHIHWPEYGLYFPDILRASSRLLILLATVYLAKFKGAKLIWTAHNLQSHEGHHPKLEKWFWKIFLHAIDGYFSLSYLGQKNVIARFPQLREKPFAVTPIGHYQEIYPDEIDRETARDRFSILSNQTVIVCAGAIRPYKNIPHLIKVFTTAR